MTHHTGPRQAALVAGVGILFVAAFAGFGNLVVVEGMVTPGDPAQTAADVMAAPGTFRLGVASLYVVVLLDVIVAWGLLRVFSPVNVGVSRLAAWLRLTYAAVFVVAISQLAGIPDLLGSDTYSSTFTADQLDAQAMQKVDAFNDIWFAGLILFGAHLVLIGYLAYVSGTVPRALGVLLVIAGLGYGYDSVMTVLSDGSPFLVSTLTFLGELLLAIWLVVRGGRSSRCQDVAEPAVGAADTAAPRMASSTMATSSSRFGPSL